LAVKAKTVFNHLATGSYTKH